MENKNQELPKAGVLGLGAVFGALAVGLGVYLGKNMAADPAPAPRLVEPAAVTASAPAPVASAASEVLASTVAASVAEPAKVVAKKPVKVHAASHTPQPLAAPTQTYTHADLQRAREQAAAEERRQQNEQAMQQARMAYDASVESCKQQFQVNSGARIGWDVAGGVAGGAVGSQFGKGKGRTAMTILGAVGGAYGADVVQQRQAEAGYNNCVNNAQRVYDSATSRYQSPGY